MKLLRLDIEIHSKLTPDHWYLTSEDEETFLNICLDCADLKIEINNSSTRESVAGTFNLPLGREEANSTTGGVA